MTTLEREIGFLIAMTALLGNEATDSTEESQQQRIAESSRLLSPVEYDVLLELRLSEKRCGAADRTDSQGALTTSLQPEHVALLAESPLAALYTGDTTSPYTRFVLSFYSSALYTQLPTKVNTAAVRLFQRFLCSCRPETLRCLHESCGATTMDVVLRECLSLAGNLSSTVQIASPTSVTGVVLGELDYDAHEVSPLDYLDTFIEHIPYLSQMCQQASLLLLAHEEMIGAPASTVVLLTVLFTARNMGAGEAVLDGLMSAWPADQRDRFYRLDAFLNHFT